MGDTSRPISKRLRFEILRRDGHRCRYCGATADEAPLTVDHVIPRALGGIDDGTNLVTACADCNNGKASVSPDNPVVDEVREQAERFRQALRIVAERDRQQREAQFEKLDLMVSDWAQEWFLAVRECDRKWKLPNDASASLIRFYESGLDEVDLHWALGETFARAFDSADGWRYFCAICWNTIRQRTDEALAMIDKARVQ